MNTKKLALLIIAIFILVAGAYGYRSYHRNHQTLVSEQATPQKTFTYFQVAQNFSDKNLAQISLPVSYSLQIPFTPQAPTGNWDTLHNEACEEASGIMANAYFSGDIRTTLPAPEVESEITNLTNWQQQHFGYYLDTTAAETAQMITGVYNLKASVQDNFTEQDIKQDLVNSKVVIIPVDGQKLGNPYYKTPGPIYHMLVIRGYTAGQLITNDSGTKHGLNYTYPFPILEAAAVDWNHATNTIDPLKKVIIVISK